MFTTETSELSEKPLEQGSQIPFEDPPITYQAKGSHMESFTYRYWGPVLQLLPILRCALSPLGSGPNTLG